MRSLAREAVFKFLFSQLFNQDDEGLFTVLCKELNDSDKSFAEQLLLAVDKDKELYLNKIEKLAIGYKLNRLYNVDKCALMLGMAELDTFVDTPKHTINKNTIKNFFIIFFIVHLLLHTRMSHCFHNITL